MIFHRAHNSQRIPRSNHVHKPSVDRGMSSSQQGFAKRSASRAVGGRACSLPDRVRYAWLASLPARPLAPRAYRKRRTQVKLRVLRTQTDSASAESNFSSPQRERVRLGQSHFLQAENFSFFEQLRPKPCDLLEIYRQLHLLG